MGPSNSDEVDRSEESRESEKSETPINPPSPDDKSRFLKRRTKHNVTNDYHPSHNPRSVATLPEPVETEADEADREDPLVLPTTTHVSDEDIRRLKQELSHLPFDKVLRMLSINSYDVDVTIEMGKELVEPDLVPNYVKDFFVANIAVERNINPTRGLLRKPFYFAKDLGKVVDTVSLVNFYYNEKNKIGGNWRLEQPEPQLSSEEQAELEERLKQNNITIKRRDPSIPYKQTRGQKAAATRKANRLKKEAMGANGEGSQERETDSDSISVSSLEGPSTSAQSTSFSGPSTSASSAPGPFRTRDLPPVANSSASSNGVNESPRRKWTKKSLEEKQSGPRRSYPGRLRKPPTFFE